MRDQNETPILKERAADWQDGALEHELSVPSGCRAKRGAERAPAAPTAAPSAREAVNAGTADDNPELTGTESPTVSR